MNKPIPPDELRIRRQLRDDFFAYANLLEIRTKSGGFEKLELNATQKALHERFRLLYPQNPWQDLLPKQAAAPVP